MLSFITCHYTWFVTLNGLNLYEGIVHPSGASGGSVFVNFSVGPIGPSHLEYTRVGIGIGAW